MPNVDTEPAMKTSRPPAYLLRASTVSATARWFHGSVLSAIPACASACGGVA